MIPPDSPGSGQYPSHQEQGTVVRLIYKDPGNFSSYDLIDNIGPFSKRMCPLSHYKELGVSSDLPRKKKVPNLIEKQRSYGCFCKKCLKLQKTPSYTSVKPNGMSKCNNSSL